MTSPTPLAFTLVITGAPYSSQAPQTALSFAQAVIAEGHSIDRVFLYGDGVHLASALSTPPSDETNWSLAWAEFLIEHGIPGVACIASALRRGVLSSEEQQRYERSAANLVTPYQLLGLGEWVESIASPSKTLYFHGEH